MRHLLQIQLRQSHLVSTLEFRSEGNQHYAFCFNEKYGNYTVKKVSDIPVSSRDVTYQTLSGQE
jgi:hypothetical protein